MHWRFMVMVSVLIVWKIVIGREYFGGFDGTNFQAQSLDDRQDRMSVDPAKSQYNAHENSAHKN